MKSNIKPEEIVMLHGSDIILSNNMQSTKKYKQHGNTSVFEHSVNVACLCIYIAMLFNIKVNRKSLVRGALLHDYFLYDWHVIDSSHKWHGFTHAKSALSNASRDFNLNYIEKDMILKHMFPLNIKLPRYKESVILCIADKIYTIFETLYIKGFEFKIKSEGIKN